MEQTDARRRWSRDTTEAYFKLHFTAIICSIAVISALLVVLGKHINNDVMISLSTAVFSASTIGAVFKFIGFDVFMIALIRKIVYERRFLEVLNGDELRRIIRETIITLRGGTPQDEMYAIFEKYLLEDLVGVLNNNRRLNVTLTRYEGLGPRLVHGKTIVTYDVCNESPSSHSLFEVEGQTDVIWKGTMTIPEPLRRQGLPADHATLWNLQKDDEHETGVCIDGNWVNPTIEKDWKEPNDHSKGVKYKVSFVGSIVPSSLKHVILKNFCIYDTHDYIVRKFGAYGKDVEVIVTKPEDVIVYVSWFLTARGKHPEAVILPAETSETSFVQKVQGYLVPGNGFVIMWWPKNRPRTN